MKREYVLRSSLSEEEQERLREKDRIYHQTRKDKTSYKEYKIKDYQINKARRNFVNKSSYIKTKYGITWSEFEEMYESQKGLCAICKKEEKNRMLSLDHSHVTKKVRGLLCGSCNRGLGLFKDDPKLLQAAKEYVS